MTAHSLFLLILLSLPSLRAGGEFSTEDVGQEGKAEEEENNSKGQPSSAEVVRLVRVLNDVPSAEAFIQGAQSAVVGFLKDQDSSEADAFNDLVQKLRQLPFAVTYNATVWEKFNISRNTITLFKKFDEGRADYPIEEGHLKPNVTKIIRFLRHNELHLVTEYNRMDASQIFRSGIPIHLLLLVSKTSKEYQPLLEEFKGVAPEFRGKVIFVLVDTDKKENQRVTSFFDVKEPDLPAICLFHVATNAVKVMKGEYISRDTIRRFCTDFMESKEELYQSSLTPYVVKRCPDVEDSHPHPPQESSFGSMSEARLQWGLKLSDPSDIQAGHQ
ncbi:endoplasmic reticulum resident protein 27 [Pristis pectinata]|uniref:endoplasmic reticulum resident protein 27 n=1 Tax=Pristis pectinata TaxID=685728 RepID=UPI00223CB199|nr:endoplasmic reticulum resident protein 27 [Pristis pectinata]